MRRWAWAVAVLAALLMAAAGAFARSGSPLLGGLGGQAAISALGNRLPAIARAYHKTPGQLRDLLLRDPTLHLDRTGRLFFRDPPARKPTANAARSAAVPWVGGELAPLDQTFALHSKPNADKTIYLNFRGRRLFNSAWNGDAEFSDVPPFDIDGNPGINSDTELSTIQYVWQQVAEDYSPFDVDVTTESPPDERIVRSAVSDNQYGIEVLYVPWGGDLTCSCGGASYMGSFFETSEFNKPVLVYYANWMFFPQYLASTASHELGHSLGLLDDGNSHSDLYGGHGDSAVNGWEPIMGAETWRPLSQFSKGEYFDANNHEDDFAVIESNGLPLRSDDVGDSAVASLVLPMETNIDRRSGDFDGIISSGSDRDVFSLVAGKGPLTASVNPASSSPNADLVLTLMESSGHVIAVSDPHEDLGAGLEQQITVAGTYYLEVRGMGEGDPQEAGYSGYGSVGAYRLSASFAARVPPTAAFTVSPPSGTAPLDVSFDGSASGSDGRITRYAWAFGDGTGAAGSATALAQKTFTSPGTYAVTLQVTDDAGITDSSTRSIVVMEAPVPRVAKVDIKLTGSGRKVKARAAVSVVDVAGKPADKAVVMAAWSGSVSGSVAGRTGRSGTVVFNSPSGTASGCVRLTVTAIKLGAASYVPPPGAYGESCR